MVEFKSVEGHVYYVRPETIYYLIRDGDKWWVTLTNGTALQVDAAESPLLLAALDSAQSLPGDEWKQK